MGFNQTVLIIATVLLIITLTILAIILYNSHGGVQFPPEVGQCPDFWTLDKKDGGKTMWSAMFQHFREMWGRLGGLLRGKREACLLPCGSNPMG